MKKKHIPSLRADLSGVEFSTCWTEVAPWVTNEFEGDLRGRRLRYFHTETGEVSKRSQDWLESLDPDGFLVGEPLGKWLDEDLLDQKCRFWLHVSCGFKVSEISPKIHDNDLWSCHGKVVWCFCFQLNYMIIWLAIPPFDQFEFKVSFQNEKL